MSERNKYLEEKKFSNSKFSNMLCIGTLVATMALTGCGVQKDIDATTNYIVDNTTQVEQTTTQNSPNYLLYTGVYSEPIPLNVVNELPTT